MRIPFIFWNLKQLPLEARVASLAAEHQARFIILAECSIQSAEMIAALDAAALPGFTVPLGVGGDEGDIKLFSRLPDYDIRPVFDDPNNHIVIRRLVRGAGPDLLLVIVHSQSKRNWSDDDQVQGAIRLGRTIAEWEKEFQHQRTMLVGDLNMNPFEKGVVGSGGLHAVMTRRIARRGTRVVDAEERPFFYNPMWSFFGERTEGPPGTHYYPAGGKPIAYFWNIRQFGPFAALLHLGTLTL